MRWMTLVVLGLLTGCVANNGLVSASVAQANIDGLAKLELGMNEEQVLCIMNVPYKKQEMAHGKNAYAFWFYVVKGVALGQSRPVHQNLTPLIFANGALVGWGYDFYKHVKNKLVEEANPSQEENRALEKAIENLRWQIPSSSPLSENDEVKKEPKPKKKKKSKNDTQKESKDKDKLNDQDRGMIQEENDQNFDFW